MTVEELSLAEHSHGFFIIVGVKEQVGILFIAKSKVKREKTTTHNWKYGKINFCKAEIV